MSRRLAVPSTIVLTIGLLFTALPTQAGAFRDGLRAYRAGDFATARQLWRPLAIEGDSRAQT